jgi:hypothetical protein
VNFFDPLPPPPQPEELRWAPPAWDRPSEGTLPSTLTVDAVLSQDDAAVVSIPYLDVYPNGFRVNVVILLNPHRAADIRSNIHRGPMGMMRIGVRFADGRTGGQGRAFDVTKDDQGMPTQPVVRPSGGGGGSGGWKFGAWVFPLPPNGPLEIFVALPPPATGESSATVDGTAIRAAGERAKIVWT